MDEPDYESYSTEDLADVLNHIDRIKYPERATRVEWIYKKRGGTKHYRELVKRRPYRFWSGVVCLVYSPFILIYGLQSDRLFYTINIESHWERVLAFLFLLLLALQWFRSMESNEN